MESNSIVKWVHRKVGAEINFLRLDIRTKAAKKVMKKYDIKMNSAYLIFDQNGTEVWRSYAIPLNGRKAVKILEGLLHGQNKTVSEF